MIGYLLFELLILKVIKLSSWNYFGMFRDVVGLFMISNKKLDWGWL